MKKVFTLLVLLIMVIAVNSVKAQWTIASPNIYNSNSGNVGIGTTTPFAGLTINKGGDAAPFFGIGSAAWGWHLYERTADGDILFKASNNSIMKDVLTLRRANGNVGIGTTTPATSLDVTRRSLGQLAKFSDHSDVVIPDGESYISVGYSPINLGYHYVAGDSYGFLEMNGGTRAIVIKKNGKVGIGATTPTEKLTIQGNVLFTSTDFCIGFANDIADYYFGKIDASNGVYGRSYYGWSLNGSTGIGLHVHGNNNVGIGTITPASKLSSIASGRNLSLYSNITPNNNGILFDSNDGTAQQIYTDFNGSNTEQAFILGTYSNRSNQMVLASNGNVGIGTTAPSSKLDISGVLNPPVASGSINQGMLRLGFQDHSWAGGELNFGIINSGEYPAWIQSQKPTDYSTSRPLLLNPNGGNVGIGTTTPSYRLTVETPKLDNNYVSLANFWSGGAYGGGTRIGISNNSTTWIETNSGYSSSGQRAGSSYFDSNFANSQTGGTYGAINFYTNDINRLVIKPNGNVGIGTTNPQNMLDVAGTIRCTEVKVVALPWADFVFHPSYKLRTLGEVEQFIKTNNHLPEIPTTAEVKENGIGLGEMNAKLLQKVEELTLYMIQMQKENEDLKSRVTKLENRK